MTKHADARYVGRRRPLKILADTDVERIHEAALGVLAERRHQGHETYVFLGLSGLTATDANFPTWLSARLRARHQGADEGADKQE